MEIEVRQVEGVSLVEKGESERWVAMDGSKEVGEAEAGSRPMEMVLVALGGCTGMDVASLLDKMRVDYGDLRLEISASREKEHPKVFTEIHIYFKVWGNVPEDKVKKAIDKSQNKYCPVTAMFREGAESSYDYEIIEE